MSATQRMIVNTANLNYTPVRKEPYLGDNITGYVRHNNLLFEVELEQYQGNGLSWYKIRGCGDNKLEGYVASEHVDFSYDIWDYVIGDPVLHGQQITYGLQYMSQGTEVCYPLIGDDRAYQVKNANSEMFWTTENHVIRFVDTSYSEKELYSVHSSDDVNNPASYGVKWAKRFMAVGDIYDSVQNPVLRAKINGNIVSQWAWTIRVKLVAHLPLAVFPNGKILENVLVIRQERWDGQRWVLFETMWYAYGIGLVGFRRDDRHGVTREWIEQNPHRIDAPSLDFNEYSQYIGELTPDQRHTRDDFDYLFPNIPSELHSNGCLPINPPPDDNDVPSGTPEYIINYNFSFDPNTEADATRGQGGSIVTIPDHWEIELARNGDYKDAYVYRNHEHGGHKVEFGQTVASVHIGQPLFLRAGKYVIKLNQNIQVNQGDQSHVQWGLFARINGTSYRSDFFASDPILWSGDSVSQLADQPFRFNFASHGDVASAPQFIQLELTEDTYFERFGLSVGVAQGDVIAQFRLFLFAVDRIDDSEWDNTAHRLQVRDNVPVMFMPEQVTTPPPDSNYQLTLTFPSQVDKDLFKKLLDSLDLIPATTWYVSE